jgi:hypothetical protein
MMLTHWGNTNSKYKTSTTAYFSDSWNDVPSDWRGDHPCYDPKKDLVLPAWKYLDPSGVLENLVARYFIFQALDLYEMASPNQGCSRFPS